MGDCVKDGSEETAQWLLDGNVILWISLSCAMVWVLYFFSLNSKKRHCRPWIFHFSFSFFYIFDRTQCKKGLCSRCLDEINLEMMEPGWCLYSWYRLVQRVGCLHWCNHEKDCDFNDFVMLLWLCKARWRTYQAQFILVHCSYQGNIVHVPPDNSTDKLFQVVNVGCDTIV